MSIKTISFSKNHAGIDHVKVDTSTWTITQTCAALPDLYGRHCRIVAQGERFEYRSGDHYVAVPADIKMISELQSKPYHPNPKGYNHE